ncbi:hypothetical protein BC833DRAFT_577993, partial [Globomyces pollinis-pini]
IILLLVKDNRSYFGTCSLTNNTQQSHIYKQAIPTQRQHNMIFNFDLPDVINDIVFQNDYSNLKDKMEFNDNFKIINQQVMSHTSIINDMIVFVLVVISFF